MSKMSNEEFIEIYKNKFENIKLDDTIFNGTMKPLRPRLTKMATGLHRFRLRRRATPSTALSSLTENH